MASAPVHVHRTRRRVLKVAFVLVGVLAAVEVGWRVTIARREARRAEEPGEALYRREFRLAAGPVVSDGTGPVALIHHPWLVFHPGRGSVEAGLDLNSRGFRGREWSEPKRPGTFRIVVTGGSAAFGMGASSGDWTLPAQLEAQLNADGGERFEVLNAGVIGYTATQELLLFATELSVLEPDLLIAFDGWNDFEIARETPGSQPLLPVYFKAFDDLAAESVDPIRRLFGWSMIWQGLERRADKRARNQLLAERDAGPLEAVVHPQCWEVYRHALTQLTRLAVADGAGVILCLQPTALLQAGPGEGPKPPAGERSRSIGVYPRFGEIAASVAAHEGATYVNAQDLLRGESEPVFCDVVHLTDRGYQAVARGLLEPVLRLSD